MVAQVSVDRKPELLQALKSFPREWRLTPVDHKKAAYRNDWTNERLERKVIAQEIRSGRAKGYGLLTGKISGGILAIDCDGPAAHELLAKHGELPATVAFTSGKPGRCQYLLQVPEEFWEAIATVKHKTGVKGSDGKEQLLELRWDGCQSVLPPSAHPETGRYHWVNAPENTAIAECPTWVIELMLNHHEEAPTPQLQPQPQPQQQRTRYEDISVPVAARVPLESCLAKESRALLSEGAGQGQRNDSGAKLARDLIGTANYLQQIGQSFDGDPRSLFEEFSRRCSPPLPTKEINTIWKSAQKSHPSPSCPEEGVENCIRAWYWKNEMKEVGKPTGKAIAYSNLVRLPSNGGKGGGGGDEPPVGEWLKKEIISLIEKGISGSQKRIEINRLAKISDYFANQIEKIWDSIEAEIAAESDRDENAAELDTLLSAKQARLDIFKILPKPLASAIERLAAELGLRPECYLTALLTTASTLHHNQTWVRLWDASEFEVTPNLFAAIVAVASQYKSPILRAIATKPLAQLQKQAKQEYQEELRQYALDLEEWENSDHKDPDVKPVAPVRRLFYFTGATNEGIIKQFNDAPQAGLLNLVDELAGKFKSANQYRNGRGSDEEDLLSLYDGTASVVLRASGIKADLEDGLNFGLLGSIQPKVLAKFLKDCSDSNGNWARFIFVNQPVSMAEWKEDSGGTSLTPMLVDLYKTISQIPARTYTLSPKAKERFRKIRNRAEKLRVAESRPGLAHYWGKVPGRIGKFAANLHVIWSYFEGVHPSAEIPYERVREAEALSKFYADQTLSLYGDFEDPNAIAPKLAKVIELATNQKAAIKLRDISRSTKLTAEQVREVCDELIKMGRGTLTKVGKAIAFQLSPTVEKSVTVPVTHESLATQAFNPSVTTVTNCHHFLEESSTSEKIPTKKLESEINTEISVTPVTVGDSSEKPLTEGVSTVTTTVTDFSETGDSCSKVAIAEQSPPAPDPTDVPLGIDPAVAARFPEGCKVRLLESGIESGIEGVVRYYDINGGLLYEDSEGLLNLAMPDQLERVE